MFMYDSAVPGHIPANPPAVAGYADGAFNWTASAWNSFLGAWRIPITVRGGHTGARICDCEPGDLTPAQAAVWLTVEHGAGRTGTLYGTADTHAAVAKLCHVPYYRWLAQWDGKAQIPAGYVAKQYQSTPGYDISTANPLWVQQVAVGGPPDEQGLTDATVVVIVGTPPGTTDWGTIRAEAAGLEPGVVLSFPSLAFTSDVGTLRAAGLL